MSTFEAQGRRGLGGQLLQGLASNWWILLVRGIAALVFAVLAILWPMKTILALALVWGFYAVFDGAASVWLSISGAGGEKGARWWLGITGGIGILAGMTAIAWPALTAAVLLLVLGMWAILVGVLQIVGALRLRKEIEGEWWLALGGLAAVLFGAILVLQPRLGAITVAWTAASFALLFGITLVALAFKLRKFKRAG
jgi:uncharacterized membrane protein HdeD (DUF308 family)